MDQTGEQNPDELSKVLEHLHNLPVEDLLKLEVDPDSPLGKLIARLQNEINNPRDAVAGYSSAA